MPRSVDPEHRRAELRAAVVAIAASDGVAAVTIRRVADYIGMSTSGVTHYVGSRDELLRAAIEEVAADVEAHADRLVAAADDPRSAAAAILDWAVIDLDATTRGLWLALVVGAHDDEVVRHALDDFNRRWHDRLRRLLGEAGLADQWRLDVLAVLVDGLLVVEADDGQSWTSGRRRAVLGRVAEVVGLPRPRR